MVQTNPLNPVTGDPRVGVRHAPTQVSIVAIATSTVLWSRTAGRTAVIRKVIVRNRNAASGVLRIGSTDAAAGGAGGVWTQRLPELGIPAGITTVFTQDELPRYEFGAYEDFNTDIVAQSSVGAAAPNDVQVTVEVEEFGEQ